MPRDKNSMPIRYKKMKCEVRKAGKYVRCRKKPPASFDPRSFRTVRVGKNKHVIGCPKKKGKRCWQPQKQHCVCGMKTQSILIPLSKTMTQKRDRYFKKR